MVDDHPDKKEKFPLNLKESELEKKVTVPRMHFENSLSIENVIPEEGAVVLEMRPQHKKGIVHWERRIRGTFSEIFELQYFPFDVQALSIDIRIASLHDEIRERYVASRLGKKGKREPPKILRDVVLAEWRVYKAAVECSKSNQGGLYRCHLTIRRRHQFCGILLPCHPLSPTPCDLLCLLFCFYSDEHPGLYRLWWGLARCLMLA